MLGPDRKRCQSPRIKRTGDQENKKKKKKISLALLTMFSPWSCSVFTSRMLEHQSAAACYSNHGSCYWTCATAALLQAAGCRLKPAEL